MKPALLVLDMQKAFYELDEVRPSMDWARTFINQAIQLFHRADMPVIFVQHQIAEGSTSPKFDLIPDLLREERDYLVIKTHKSSFWQTPLEAMLKDLGCDMVVVCGVAAGHCVNMTYEAAIERGFKSVVLQHGVAGWKQTHIDMTHELCSIVSLAMLEACLSTSSDD